MTVEERRAKARGFLWIVQAGLLAEAGRVRRTDPSKDPQKVAEYSGSGMFIRIDEAVRAAGRIPDDMTAAEAAKAFCAFYAGSERSRDVPHWFVRYGQEQHDYSAVSRTDRFLWTVQTAALADIENQAGWDAKDRKPERFGPQAIVETMAQAVRVAALIPNEIDATAAASEFLDFYAPGMGERRTPPKWCRG
ncbi:hypothetical protein MKL09_25230 [Methylobacterium sp. J-048]|nr:hypothetical protein [Methylobacterium sp. J-048]